MTGDTGSRSDPEQATVKSALLTLADGGISAGVLVFLGAWLGGYLDQKFHCQPWLTLTFCLTGAGLGLGRLVVKALKLTGGQSARKSTTGSAASAASSESLGSESSESGSS